MEKALCPFCDAEYIVEKAINFYNIQANQVTISDSNIVINNGPQAQALMQRGDEFFNDGDFCKALEYYHSVLDHEPDNMPARERIQLLQSPLIEISSRKMGTLVTGSLTKLSFYDIIDVKKTGIPNERIEIDWSQASYKYVNDNTSIMISAKSPHCVFLLHATTYDRYRFYILCVVHSTKNLLCKSLDENSTAGIKPYFAMHSGKYSTFYLTQNAIVVYMNDYYAVVPYYAISKIYQQNNLMLNYITIIGKVLRPVMLNFEVIDLSESDRIDIICEKKEIPHFCDLIIKAIKGHIGETIGYTYVL